MQGLLPGARSADARRIADECRVAGINIRGGNSVPTLLLEGYLRWCRTSADRLAPLLRPGLVDQLLLNPTYWALLNSVNPSGAAFTTVQAELDARTAALQAFIDDLLRQTERWSGGFGAYVVLDTGVFIEHRELFPASLSAIEDRLSPVGTVDIYPNGAPMQFVIPMQVIDELDKTKADRSRGRAQVSLARLNSIFASPESPATVPELREGSQLHLLLDEPGHVRMPLEDDEIVDRALYLESVAGPHSVAVACLDTGMALRARLAGLRSYHLEDDRRPEKARATKDSTSNRSTQGQSLNDELT